MSLPLPAKRARTDLVNAAARAGTLSVNQRDAHENSLRLKCHRLVGRLCHRTPRLYRNLYRLFKKIMDRHERNLIKLYLKSGMTVLDLGANIGVYSEYLLRLVGPGGQLHLFEPSDTNFALLQKAFRNDKNIFLNKKAVSISNGHATLYESDELNVENRLWTNSSARKWHPVEVECVRLDDHFRPGTKIDFVKMDVEAYEFYALQGMERILAENPGIVMIAEFGPYALTKAGSDPKQMISFLQNRGFKISVIEKNGLKRFEDAYNIDKMSENVGVYFNILIRR